MFMLDAMISTFNTSAMTLFGFQEHLHRAKSGWTVAIVGEVPVDVLTTAYSDLTFKELVEAVAEDFQVCVEFAQTIDENKITFRQLGTCTRH